MSTLFKIIVNNGPDARQELDVQSGQGQPVRISAKPTSRFVLQDPAKQPVTAPDSVRGSRKGNNLHLSLGESTVDDVIIEDYYAQIPAETNAVTGLGEDGLVHEYIVQDTTDIIDVSQLANGSASVDLVLGAEGVQTGAALAAVAPLIGPGTLAAGAGAGAAAVAAGGGGGGTAANTAPVAEAATNTATESGPVVTGRVSATDADANSTLTYSAVGDVPAGLTLNADGTYSFDASNAAYKHLAAGATQTVVLSYKANDGTADSNTATLTITVTGTNDAPVASAAANSATKGAAAISGSVSATDADDGAVLTYSAVGSLPAGLTFNADGTYSFDPANAAYSALQAGQTQNVVLSFKANDGSADSATQTLTIAVTGGTANTAPVAQAASASATEGGAVVNGSVSATDANNDALTFSAVGTVPAGLTFNADGSYSFDPTNSAYTALTAGQTQDVVLSFKANDGKVDSNTSTLTISLAGVGAAPTPGPTPTPANTAPTNTVPGAQTTNEDTAKIISGLSVADADAGNGTVTVTLAVAHGTITAAASTGVTITDNGMASVTLSGTTTNINTLLAQANGVSYSPTNNYNGSDTLTMTSNDGGNSGAGGALSDVDTVSITVNAVNDAPVATIATNAATEGAVSAVTGSVSATDADDNAALTYAAVGALPAGLTFNSDGTYSFDPTNAAYNHLAAGATQDVVLTFKANDGTADSTPQTLTITVTGTNDAPVAAAATKTATEGGAVVNGSVTASDADDGAVLTYAAVGAAPAGLTFNTNGTYSFDPTNEAYNQLAAGATQNVVLTFKANDGTADSTPQTLTITVTGNQAPVVTPKSIYQVPAANPLYNQSFVPDYSEGNSAVKVGQSTTYSDVDAPLGATSLTLAGGMVSISGNHVPGDVLTFAALQGVQVTSSPTDLGMHYVINVQKSVFPSITYHPTITADYNTTTGAMTLSGGSTTSAYLLVLRSIAFSSTSDDPTDLKSGTPKTTRTISWSLNDGLDWGPVATSQLTVQAFNDAPTVTTQSTATPYTENDPATVANSAITLSDGDTANLRGAAVTISSGFVAGDALAFADANGITSSWDATNHVLTLSGSATVANYQAALRAVTYVSSSQAPSNVTRTLSWQVDDGQGYNNASNAGTSTITVTDVDDAGIASLSGSVVVGQTLTAENVTDPDGTVSNVSYQWQSSFDGVSWTNISNATASTYVLTNAEIGKQVHAVVSYNAGGFNSQATTASTTAVPVPDSLDLGNVNGVHLNLIQKVTSGGKTYFFLDASGDGSASAVDKLGHDALDTLFNNGTDTTGDSTPMAGQDTERSLIINGHTLILPTRDELLALHADTNVANPPSGWGSDLLIAEYWSATQSTNGASHISVGLSNGITYNNLLDANAAPDYVAIEFIAAAPPLQSLSAQLYDPALIQPTA